MKVKRKISFILAAVMTLGSVNIAFADMDNGAYIQEEDNVVPMYGSSDYVAYAVEGGNIYIDKATGTVYIADENVISADIPVSVDGVTVTSIGRGAFAGSSSLKSITVPESVTFIDYQAFNYCTSLTDINVAQENTNYASVDGVLFNKNISEIIHYPEGKTNDRYIIPDSVASVGALTFLNCNSLTDITIPDSVAYIGIGAFTECSSLTGITIPEGITSVEMMTFRRCSSLTSIDIPHSVTFISDHAFSGCSSLKEINIPESVISIGNCAFASCNELKDVYYGGSREQWNNIDIGSENDSLYNAAIHCKDIDIIRGDADADGKLTASDGAVILQKVLRSTYRMPIEDVTADYMMYIDVTADGKLDTADGACVLQKVLKSTYKMPVEEFTD